MNNILDLEENMIVMCRIIQNTDTCIYVKLLEYDVEGTLIFTDMSKKKEKMIHKKYKIGFECPLMVVSVKSSMIELTYRNISDEEKLVCIEDYKKTRRLLSIINSVKHRDPTFEFNVKPESSDIHIYDYMMQNPDLIEEPYRHLFVAEMNKYMVVKENVVKKDIKICSDYGQVLEVKEKIAEIMKKANEEYKVEIGYKCPPIYTLTVTSMNDVNMFLVNEGLISEQ